MPKLIVGWRVNKNLQPLPFSDSNIENIKFKDYESNIVCFNPVDLCNHTSIIAQSGSGKSYFVGRLLEEIITKSKIQCFVIDPNADYRNFYQLSNPKEENSKWENKRIGNTGLWQITHEITKDNVKGAIEYFDNWNSHIINKIKIIRGDIDDDKPPFESLRLFWPSLSSNLFSSELNILDKTEFQIMHFLITWLGFLIWIRFWLGEASSRVSEQVVLDNMIQIKRNLELHKQRGVIHISGDQEYFHKEFSKILETEFDFSRICREAKEQIETEIKNDWRKISLLPYPIKSRLLVNSNLNLNTLFLNKFYATQLVSERILTYYELIHKEFHTLNLFEENPLKRTTINKQINIFDMPSFDNKETRLLILGQLIDDIWDQSRFDWSMMMSVDNENDIRRPKMIIIDEAHNLIPEKCVNDLEFHFREKIRTIAAEGRKYGISLLIISQRPDKLDKKILSECKNVGIMRINNQSLIDDICSVFGLDDQIEKIIKANELNTGRTILFGNWTSEQGLIMYSGTRRTKEGGKKIPTENY